MENIPPDLKRYFENKSWRHHYIPQFLINGFTNSDGKLFVYDKQSDKILTKQLPPKSIFFEKDRNTVDIKEGLQSSIIEDRLFSEMDNNTSKVVNYYQNEELSKIEIQMEHTGILLFLMVNLFWRIPKTDFAFEDLMERSEIVAEGIDPEILRNDPTWRKLQRSGMFKHHIEEIVNFGNKGTKHYNIHQSDEPIFLIGDYPFVLRNKSSKFRDFDDTDILFAISSKRLYSSLKEPLRKFSGNDFYSYNAAIINQSVRYVASGNLDVLENSIKLQKELYKRGLLFSNEFVFI